MRISAVLLLAADCSASRPATAQGTYPLHTPPDDFSASILDCSSWIEAPTGKHGFLQRRGENFVFGDGPPARFRGSQANLFPERGPEIKLTRSRDAVILVMKSAYEAPYYEIAVR